MRLQATFRISELTSNVPFAVRSAFRNDNIEYLLDTNNSNLLRVSAYSLSNQIHNFEFYKFAYLYTKKEARKSEPLMLINSVQITLQLLE